MNRKILIYLTFAAAVAAIQCTDRARPADSRDASRPDATAPASSTRPDMAGTTRVADITGKPNDYIGKTVTVVADVEEVLTPYAFSLDEDAMMAGGIDNDLLVLSPKSANLSNIDDQWLNNKVRVTGAVRQMTLAEIEREIGRDLDPKVEVELERVRPVLIASAVTRTGN